MCPLWGCPGSGLPVAKLATVPLFFGNVIYSFEGCGSVPSIHESMLVPGEFNAVLGYMGEYQIC